MFLTTLSSASRSSLDITTPCPPAILVISERRNSSGNIIGGRACLHLSKITCQAAESVNNTRSTVTPPVPHCSRSRPLIHAPFLSSLWILLPTSPFPKVTILYWSWSTMDLQRG